MKKILSFAICLALLAAIMLPANAAEQAETVYSQEFVLEDGTVVLDEIIVSTQARSTDKTATRRNTFTRDGVVIAIIAIQGTFRYDGNTVSVISKNITQVDTYDGWKLKDSSFTASGGTITLSGKLSKLLIFNAPFTMSLTCDKNGNLS